MSEEKEVFAADTRGWAIEVTRGNDGRFFAELPFRAVAIEGNTQEQAFAGLVRYYSTLARKGDFNPFLPEEPGVPPIQHVLSLLEEALRELIQRREANRTVICDKLSEGDPERSYYMRHPVFIRDNEVISGLATAIAALARVKEL